MGQKPNEKLAATPTDESSAGGLTLMEDLTILCSLNDPPCFLSLAAQCLAALLSRRSCHVLVFGKQVSRWGERITPWSLLGDACRLRTQGCNNCCIECVLVSSHLPCLARQLTSPDGRSLILYTIHYFSKCTTSCLIFVHYEALHYYRTCCWTRNKNIGYMTKTSLLTLGILGIWNF